MASTRREMGRPTAYPDSGVVGVGIGLRPDQAQRLRAYATERGNSLSKLVRSILSQWEQDNGLLNGQTK
jgi:hypothetical protein